jgi:hypothetical protein
MFYVMDWLYVLRNNNPAIKVVFAIHLQFGFSQDYDYLIFGFVQNVPPYIYI